MFSSIGLSEILLILLIALVVIGPEKLPEMARMLGKGVREVRRASNLFRDMFLLEESTDYRQQDRRNQPGGEPHDGGGDQPPHVAGTIARGLPRREPTRPVRLDPPRRATGTSEVDLPACATSTQCTFEELNAPRG